MDEMIVRKGKVYHRTILMTGSYFLSPLAMQQVEGKVKQRQTILCSTVHPKNRC